KRNRDALRADLKTRSDQELDRSWREINDAVVEFAREQGFDLIVPSPVIYASPKVDVTERILDRLRHQPAARNPTP
ncbi:MAG: OmpH family outer membrane protein, partial [Dokdonella sp.]